MIFNVRPATEQPAIPMTIEQRLSQLETLFMNHRLETLRASLKAAAESSSNHEVIAYLLSRAGLPKDRVADVLKKRFDYFYDLQLRIAERADAGLAAKLDDRDQDSISTLSDLEALGADVPWDELFGEK